MYIFILILLFTFTKRISTSDIYRYEINSLVYIVVIYY